MRDRLPLRTLAKYGITNTIKEWDHEPNKRNCKLTLRIRESNHLFLNFHAVKLAYVQKNISLAYKSHLYTIKDSMKTVKG